MAAMSQSDVALDGDRSSAGGSGAGDVARSVSDSVDARAFGRRRNSSGVGRGGDGDVGVGGDAGVQQSFSTVTSRDDVEYDLSEGVRLAVILNHERYPPERDLSTRTGTATDVVAIRDTFADQLGFTVEIFDELRHDEIQALLRRIQANDVELACLALFVLTHGEDNGTLQAHDMPYRLDRHLIDELTASKCPSLAGKPKMVFVQACQGERGDDGGGVRVRSRHTSHDSSSSGGYRIPNHADFLILQATYFDHFAFRSRSGSWMIQALCHCLNESDKADDLHRVLNRVKRIVAMDKVSNTPAFPERHNKKQIPLVQDTLIRELFLKRGVNPGGAGDEDDEEELSGEVQNLSTTDQDEGIQGGKKTRKKKKGDKCKIM